MSSWSAVARPVRRARERFTTQASASSSSIGAVNSCATKCAPDGSRLRRSTSWIIDPADYQCGNGSGWIINDSIKADMLVGAGGHFCPVARWLNPVRLIQRAPHGRRREWRAESSRWNPRRGVLADCAGSPGLAARGRDLTWLRLELASTGANCSSEATVVRGSRWLARAIVPAVATTLLPWLLGTRWFTRHLVLDRWFLHAHDPALVSRP